MGFQGFFNIFEFVLRIDFVAYVTFLYLLFSFLLLSSQILFSQECSLPCNDTLDIDPAPTCEIAASSAFNGDGEGYVCNLDSFCTSTYDLPPGNDEGFCPRWMWSSESNLVFICSNK